jgi:hypothetical protein
MTPKELLFTLIPLGFAATLIEHTLCIIFSMISIYVVGWSATMLLPGHPVLGQILDYIEEGLFLFLVGLLSVKLASETYKRWFPNGLPFKFIVA